jgi:hypothetical protein
VEVFQHCGLPRRHRERQRLLRGIDPLGRAPRFRLRERDILKVPLVDELQADLDLWIRDTMNKGRIRDAGASAKPDADLPGCNADDEGENDRGLTATDTKT